jgi:N-methylhydantoinase A/oxoprolinase/acetone carboxylase beta subunit
MSTSPFSPHEIRAAAAAHKELGPEYSDAVIDSFLERVDREITARVDARLGPIAREQPVQPVQPAHSNSRRAVLTGIAIGIFVTGVPSTMVAASAGGVIPGDEASVLIVLAILWAIAVGVAAFASRVPLELRRKEYGVRQTRRQAP